jgi:putative exosortase-associated protein (TIGR04073 family)
MADDPVLERRPFTARRDPVTRTPWMRVLLVGVLLVLASASAARAQTAARKCLRGLAGMTTSFLEIPGNMVRETNERGPAEGLPWGFARGLGMIVPRTLVGVYELLSAPFPAPSGYRPIMEPEFPWSYFEEGGGRSREHRGRHG